MAMGMASVNQTRPHCVNQMEKTHSKPLAARHGRGTALTRHAMCESAFKGLETLLKADPHKNVNNSGHVSLFLTDFYLYETYNELW